MPVNVVVSSRGRGGPDQRFTTRSCLRFLNFAKHWLDVHDRRTVDGFDGANAQPVLYNSADRDRVKTQGIRPVRRAGRKDTGKPTLWIGAGMNLHDVSPGAVQPGHDDDLVAHR